MGKWQEREHGHMSMWRFWSPCSPQCWSRYAEKTHEFSNFVTVLISDLRISSLRVSGGNVLNFIFFDSENSRADKFHSLVSVYRDFRGFVCFGYIYTMTTLNRNAAPVVCTESRLMLIQVDSTEKGYRPYVLLPEDTVSGIKRRVDNPNNGNELNFLGKSGDPRVKLQTHFWYCLSGRFFVL